MQQVQARVAPGPERAALQIQGNQELEARDRGVGEA